VAHLVAPEKAPEPHPAVPCPVRLRRRVENRPAPRSPLADGGARAHRCSRPAGGGGRGQRSPRLASRGTRERVLQLFPRPHGRYTRPLRCSSGKPETPPAPPPPSGSCAPRRP